MRYLNKTEQSEIIKQGWRYVTESHRPKIRAALLVEQNSFCAYTEHYINEAIDSPDIEHFDDRLKNSDEDNYWNWYLVHHKTNMHKGQIKNSLPIMLPYDETLPDRIHYINGAFRAVNEKDTEAVNLIKFLDWNNPDLANDRAEKVQLIKEIRGFHNGDDAAFIAYITARPQYLSFITVLEAELGLSLSPD